LNLNSEARNSTLSSNDIIVQINWTLLNLNSEAKNSTLSSNDIVEINKIGMAAIYVVASLAGVLVLTLIVRCLLSLRNSVRDVEMGWARHLLYLS